MGLDLRWPIGLMFSLIGLLLTIYGAATNSNAETYKGSLGININLWWGILLVAFGGFMLLMAIRGAKADRLNPPSQPGSGTTPKQ